ncbi:MAG: hypothetical protein NTW08_09820 [Gammaproteobacteria bacterium]|nr:hypothetical protein [Gammaproteobacteria bacterium]
MALTKEQLKRVLEYKAFQTYNLLQKLAFEKALEESGLGMAQIEILFGDKVSEGEGIIHELVLASQDDDTAAAQLGKLVANSSESLYEGYPSRPILENTLRRLGPDNPEIELRTIELIKTHIQICKARVIIYQVSPLMSPGLAQRPEYRDFGHVDRSHPPATYMYSIGVHGGLEIQQRPSLAPGAHPDLAQTTHLLIRDRETSLPQLVGAIFQQHGFFSIENQFQTAEVPQHLSASEESQAPRSPS